MQTKKFTSFILSLALSALVLPASALGTCFQQENDTIKVRESDTTTIRLGNRTIVIVEKRDGGTDISIAEREDERREGVRRTRPFRGHWRGLEIGLNNYLDSDFDIAQEPAFMELHSARSLNLNLNFLEYNLALRQNNIGLVTGMGLEMNNYRFTNNVSLTKDEGMIVPVDYNELAVDLNRSRFRTWYLNVPLILEFQTGHSRRSQRAHLGVGVIGGLNIGANTKVVYRDNTSKNRDKVRDDFYLRPYRYGFTFRAGYKRLNLYANYYPSTLFQTNRGPELYPIAVGFSLLGF